ncbi:hypothetical protein SAMN05421810_11229 [Amycolatopsis arida]|uniref:Uncharacterized protein n=1 Tax=Amycolatopsis arida TaxID=587909 RepID=A0A1I6ADM8_9PSEU|nr:hypothetical protein [Amycolatopsis arida]TDX97651.1 hypothetical protein CLV69_102755 [Amycolatopsis arida]SFQ66742.1 hypothetical protein SAMN05421810_11229 [Amycolatopsis arida]
MVQGWHLVDYEFCVDLYRQAGVDLSRNTALIDLAAQLPATVLSDLLNLHTETATAWNDIAGNTRAGCAAELSRRHADT